MVDCGTSSGIASILPRAAKEAIATGGKGLVDEIGRPFIVDRADDGDDELIAREQPLRRHDKIGPLDQRQRFERAVGRLAIRMARKGVRPPGLRRDRIRIVGVVPQSRVGVLADANERLLVEARLIDRKAQEFGGAVEVLDKRSHAPAHRGAVGVERDLDRPFVEGALEDLRIEVARAFVEEGGEQHPRARLVGRILGRAAAEREFERDERHSVGFDQPEIKTARGDERLHADGGLGGPDDAVFLHGRFRILFELGIPFIAPLSGSRWNQVA